jgi:hypothetical protein
MDDPPDPRTLCAAIPGGLLAISLDTQQHLTALRKAFEVTPSMPPLFPGSEDRDAGERGRFGRIPGDAAAGGLAMAIALAALLTLTGCSAGRQ